MARLSFNPQGQVQVDDGYLIALAKQGDAIAYDRIVRRYYGFVRLKASSYFLAGGDADDLIQEGLVGLYKAVRDYRTDRESSFRNFAELCITRQIITAVKTATRNKHTPLNQYVSFSATPASAQDGEPTLDEVIPGSPVHDPVNQVISSEELQSLVACLSTALSELESRVLSLYLDGYSYEQVGEKLGCDTKTVDNALQRVKRKVGVHLTVPQRDALITLVILASFSLVLGIVGRRHRRPGGAALRGRPLRQRPPARQAGRRPARADRGRRRRARRRPRAGPRLGACDDRGGCPRRRRPARGPSSCTSCRSSTSPAPTPTRRSSAWWAPTAPRAP